MSLLNVDLYVDQGSDFEVNLELTEDDGTPKNLTNFDFGGSVKRSLSSNAIAVLDVTIANSILGMINVTMNAATTANLVSERYFYDLKMKTDEDITVRLLEGILIVTPQVTEAAL